MDKIIQITSAAALMLIATSALAIPTLQLGIDGGSYDATNEDAVGIGAFTLQAGSTDGALLDNPIMFSAALVAVSGNSYTGVAVGDGGSYGQISVDGTSYDVTADMVFGTPPLDGLFPDLPGHGVFDTYYTEFSIDVADWTAATLCNMEDNNGDLTGVACADSAAGWLAEFDIDITGLSDGYAIHFDLYAIDVNNGGKVKLLKAPFSHDATGFNCQHNCVTVPSPAIAGLLGLGLIGFAASRRRL